MLKDVPKNLIYTIFLYSIFGLYTELQFMVFSTLTKTLDSMNNHTLVTHFGIKPDVSNISVINTLISFSSGIGVLCSILFIVPRFERNGRKYVVVYVRFIIGLSAACFQLAAALLQASELFIIAQVLLGTQIILRNFLTVLFVGECAPDQFRGFASTSLAVCDVIGQVIMYTVTSPNIIGKSDTWYIIPLTSCVLSILLFFTTVRLPDSPKWLVHNNRFEEAKIAIEFYHGENCDSSNVIEMMIKEKNLTTHHHISLKNILSDDTLREALKIIFAVVLFLDFTPNIMEKAYPIQIHTAFGFSVQETLNICLLISIISFPTKFIGTFLVDSIGRRPVVFLAAFVMFVKVSIMFWAQWLVFFFEPNVFSKVLVLINDFLIEFFGGLGSSGMIPLLVSELFPLPARIAVSQLIMFTAMFSNFPIVALYPVISTIMAPVVYIPFLIVQPIVVFYLFKNLPETKSKTVCEIIETLEDQITSRTNSISERTPLIRKRSHTFTHKRNSILVTSRNRACTYDQKFITI